jgi:hypothetical protein
VLGKFGVNFLGPISLLELKRKENRKEKEFKENPHMHMK